MEEFMEQNFERAVSERAVLVGLNADCFTQAQTATDETLEELEALLETAGGFCTGKILQNRHTPDSHSFIGEGKALEVKMLVEATASTMVIFDNELSPGNIRALEEIMGVTVLDRSALILDIFAQRAKTREGRLQVELAQYKYLLPRLSGMGVSLSRQGGGIGTRGPGETKLESDRRHIRERINRLQEELEQVRKVRSVQRERRMKNSVPVVAIVGYTNAGKSTLLNHLTGAGIPANNRLFDTLDTTSRQLTVSDNLDVILSDTVGFIAKLPHHLVDAFRATLEELEYADLLLHVIDASDPNREEHIEVVDRLIAKLAKPGTPVLRCYNKADLVEKTDIPVGEDVVAMSAKKGYGMEALLKAIENALGHSRHHIVVTLPYSMGGMVDKLHSGAQVLGVDYTREGIVVETIVDPILYGRLKDYITKEC
jgi:GTP-binding protein HflX